MVSILKGALKIWTGIDVSKTDVGGAAQNGCWVIEESLRSLVSLGGLQAMPRIAKTKWCQKITQNWFKNNQ